jgi:hypothetical protein
MAFRFSKIAQDGNDGQGKDMPSRRVFEKIYHRHDRRAPFSLSNKRAPCDNGTVENLVAFSAKRDQISLGIVTECATPSQVVNVEILETVTYLTPPVITRQDFLTQPRIRNGR